METKKFWGIASYFNPSGYKSKLENYKFFYKHLEIPLITVELSFNGKFELELSDADILVQIQGKDIMWQKERLLNIAMNYLPETCDKVAWVDCDLFFAEKNWSVKVGQLLEKFKLIQPFKRVYHLPPISYESLLEQIPKTKPILTEYSFAYCYDNEVPADQLEGRIKNHIFSGNALGVAWAFRKDLILDQRLYDCFIAGGGDTAFALAACGRMNELEKLRPMSLKQIKHYNSWAYSFYSSVQKEISFLDCDIYHLWHGHFKDRNYQERHKALKQFDFDPYSDIKIDKNGCWAWTNGKLGLQQYMANYFSLRKEDVNR